MIEAPLVFTPTIMRIDESLRIGITQVLHACVRACTEIVMHPFSAAVFRAELLQEVSEPEETFVQVKRCFSQQEQRNQPFQTESRPAWVPAAPAVRSLFFTTHLRITSV